MKKIRFKEMDFSDRKQIKMLVIVIVFTCVVLIGTSYAWLSVSKEASQDIGVQAGTLNLEFSDTADTTINLSEKVPISDEEGLKLEAYLFTLENMGDVDSSYVIQVENGTFSSGEQRLADCYVKYSLKKTTWEKNSSGEYVETNRAEEYTRKFNDSDKEDLNIYILNSGTLKVGEKNTYELRVWLDEDAFDSSATNKSFKKKITIEGNQKKLCQRANTLHSSRKGQYGNIGIKGTLTVGDAFDCDVNKDGVYDSTTERFYYIGEVDHHILLSYYNVLSENELQSIDWKIKIRNLTKKEIEMATGKTVDTSLDNDQNKGKLKDYPFLFENMNNYDLSSGIVRYELDGYELDGNYISYMVVSYCTTLCEGSNCFVGPGGPSGYRPTIEVAKSNILY